MKKNLVKVRNLRRDNGVNEIINYLIDIPFCDKALCIDDNSDRTFLEASGKIP